MVDDIKKCMIVFDNSERLFEGTSLGPNYCVTITCETVHESKEFYEISYDYQYNVGNLVELEEIRKTKITLHPFFPFNEGYDIGGVIVRKNRLTTLMIDLLFMSDEELGKEAGSSTPERYRLIIMKNLANLWD